MNKDIVITWGKEALAFLRRHWVGTLLILIATLVFFWPVVTRLSSYSEGGDAMFNAWTLARDHHCLQFQGCPEFANGNIYFPNKYSMFYSETQLSAGFLTLPLHWMNQNPIFAYNVWTIASFFFAGWFMYLLAKRLSKGNEFVSVLAGLAFEFAPFKMAAVSHLQSLSIFYLPLAVLLVIRYMETARKRYAIGLFATMTLLFYASWYQAVFALIGLAALVAILYGTKRLPWKQLKIIGVAIIASVVMVVPLALQYMSFSKENNANFSLRDQVNLSSSLSDYIIPHNGTILGKWYYENNPGVIINSWNIDSFSYHGVVLYAILFVLIILGVLLHRQAIRRKQKDLVAERKKLLIYVSAFATIAFLGLIISLGPLLKLEGEFTYTSPGSDLRVAIPLPWLAVDLLAPQMQFIRAIGRASVLVLFGLCCMLALVPLYLKQLNLKRYVQWGILALIALLMVVEIAPAHRVIMSQNSYAYNLEVPAVYERVKADKAIDNIIVLRSQADYPGAPIPVARAEDVLWAGYHNKNIFNGYSGYTPPRYFEDLADFTNLDASDVPRMKKLGLRYVLIDKELSEGSPLAETARSLFQRPVYEDDRYVMFKM
jgi:hypothetical protein